MGLSLRDIVHDMEHNYATPLGKQRKLSMLDPVELYDIQVIGRPRALFTLQFLAQAQSSDNRRYNVKINFANKKCSTYKDSQFGLAVPSGEEILYFDYPKQEDTVAVGCGCQDFLRTWAIALADRGACAIDLNQYQTSDLMSDKNPNNAVGVCKHIWSFIQELENGGYLR